MLYEMVEAEFSTARPTAAAQGADSTAFGTPNPDEGA
jgi:hypothetical protein